MPVAMTQQKPQMNKKQLRALVTKEFNFLKNVFSVVSLPQIKDENADEDMFSDNTPNTEEKELPKRARSIAELEEKLEKLKSQKNFNLKNKLVKKSISSKLNKKLKKKERQNNKKMKVASEKPVPVEKTEPEEKPKVPKHEVLKQQKPVFNADGKLVFSKFDFSSVGQPDKSQKKEKDPKKILENLKQQEEKFRELEEKDEGHKAKELKEKMAWKTILQKAEGQKVKDDPLLLKKSIKKMDQLKKQSKKKWEKRIENVEQKKDERQKKRKENISKKKKEKKGKIIKAAVKRGRVVI
ncbi:surfeit locus protein 6 homolog [Pectinophora gossypiella]|nr:surfeit locus protein 6 homolog [Pectinophora gossypiella]